MHAAYDDSGVNWALRTRVGRRLARNSRWLRRVGSRRLNDGFIEAVRDFGPDLVLVVKGSFLMPETVASLRSDGVLFAVFHPDAPFPGNPSYRPEHLSVAREADLYFIWSNELKARLEEHGVRRVEYLPFAWDPDVYPYLNHHSRSDSSIVFVGGWDRYREHHLEAVAEQYPLKIWGPHYWESRTDRRSLVRRCWQGHALYGREAAKVVAGAAITINILRKQNLPDGTNMRTFEAPGAGGFLLATRTAGATEIYPDGHSGAYFDSVDDLLAKIGYYRSRAEERDRIRRRAHGVTARSNRYIHRAQKILNIVSEVRSL